jgi:hypothetical protein
MSATLFLPLRSPVKRIIDVLDRFDEDSGPALKNFGKREGRPGLVWGETWAGETSGERGVTGV